MSARKPQNWSIVNVDDVVTLNPSQPEREVNDGEEVSFVPMAAVEETSGRLDPSQTRPWSEIRTGYKRFQDGDVLFAKITPSMENGKVALAKGLVRGVGAGSTEFHVLRPSEAVEGRYLLHFLLQGCVRADAQHLMQGVSGHLRVPQSFFENLELPVPPKAEQQRIVDAIEAYFSRLDAATSVLERVQASLKRYRASVLKAACEGRLVPTEAELARREGRDYEPADVLLGRILAERRKRWEAAELKKRKAKGKTPKDDPWKKKYKEPREPVTGELPELPEGWVWATWEQLSPRVTVGHVGKMTHAYRDEGIPFLRSQNVRENRYDPEGLIHITEAFHREHQKSVLKPGDLLVVRSGSVGVTCVLPEHIQEANCADLVIIKRPFEINPMYGSFYMNSVAKRDVRRQQVGIALQHFNTRSVAALPVAVPPLAEQNRIVSEVQRQLSVIMTTVRVVESRLGSTECLRHAILKRAFEGRLVPQDPGDEPASVLLERIRAQQEDGAGASRSKQASLS